MKSRSLFFWRSFFCLFLITIALPAHAASPPPNADALDLPEPVQRRVKYFGDIHPVLAQHCVSCHGPEKQKGGLRLDSLEMALRGGESYGPERADFPQESIGHPFPACLAPSK